MAEFTASTELVTGRAGTPHVSSNDVRQLHRGMTGQRGCVRMEDGTQICSVTFPETGKIQIGSGSYLWNDMHVRNNGAVQISFDNSVPTNYWLYLHYTKATGTGIEAVEFVLADEQKTSSETFGDSVTNAYVLIYSFSASSTGETNKKHHIDFPDTPATNKEKIDAANTRIDALSTETVLYSSGSDSGIHEGVTATLSESFKNFVLIGFVDSYGNIKLFRTNDVGLNSSVGVVLQSGITGSGFCYTTSHAITFTSNTQLSCSETDWNSFSLREQNSNFYSGTPIYIRKIVGIIRKVS